MRPALPEVNKGEIISLMNSRTGKAGSATAEPRQKRAIETRAALLAAVERIVAEEGTDAVTTTRVAAEAGTAVGTIYRYFADREAMLLEAYDATVARLVELCGAELAAVPPEAPVEETSRRLIDTYLAAAESMPAHARLLVAMRRLRPAEAASDPNEDRVMREIVQPFFARFAPQAAASGARMHVASTVISALVDLYLMTADPDDREIVRAEIDAQARFMIERFVASEAEA